MDNKKKIKYIKIKDDQPKKLPSKKKKSRAMKNIGHALTIVGTTFSAMLLVIVVMVCIVATVLTVYVLDFADNSYDANLRDVEMKYTSFVYAYDANGNEVVIKQLAADENRIWVDYEDMSPNIIDATTAVEDKRFYEHKGVDWQRTTSSLIRDVFNLSGAGQGGSTITQQLIKNITGDDEVTWERKLREIFRALSLEEKYTKIDIIESYLNRIWFGGMIYGVGAASEYYFGKSAADLTIAESAILAGMIRSPGSISPYADLARCKDRQLYALKSMYEQGLINTQEYESACNEKVRFARPVYGDSFGYIDERTLDDEDILEEEIFADLEYEAYKWNGNYTVTQNWYVDAGIEQVINDYADEKGISYTSARNEVYNGGYRIYLNMDIEMQEELERKYRDPYTVLDFYDPTMAKEKLLQSAFVIMDYSGTVLALAGGLGEKEGDSTFNRATQAKRAPGSTMKPIAVYSNAIEHNLITYSTMIPNLGIELPNWEDPDKPIIWPKNFGEKVGDGKLYPAWYAVRHSTNTVAVRVAQMLTPQVCFNQVTQNLGLSTLVETDIDYSPIALGGLTQGAYLVEMCAAYQVFGNGGYYYEPMLYSKVVDSKGNTILEQDFYGTQALSSDSAWITNRMMKTVITDPYGTGQNAKLDNVEVIGKTGTSNDDSNLLFIGCTPDYVGALWVGRDNNDDILEKQVSGWRTIASIWKTVMVDVQDTSQILNFTPDSSVLERNYCTQTGRLATSKCKDTELGYYRKDNVPEYCTGDHAAIQEEIYRENGVDLEEETVDAH
ncbi:MAG: transglycosylase domain-containing protein [Oscillospiraceae bacterium]